MASPSKCLSVNLFSLLILVLASFYPFHIHARDIEYFNKASHDSTKTNSAEPTAAIPPPTSSPRATEQEPSSVAARTIDQHGYGLYGQETYYQYPPTTSNPTLTPSNRMNYVPPKERKKDATNYYNGDGRVEKQRMSDTRFLENGRYYYDLSNDNKNNWENHNLQNYAAAQDKQGMSDTRFLENGRYSFHVNNQKKDGVYEENDPIEDDDDHDDSHDKLYEYENNYNNKKYNGAVGKQGMSDTKYSENGRYFYDISNEKKADSNGFQSFRYGKSIGYNAEEVSDNRNRYEGQGMNRFNFRNTENKFPEYEFDTMEEYEKHEENRANRNGYRT